MPTASLQLLGEIATVFATATKRHVVVAGGAVRDAILGVEPKDIDLFALSTEKGQLSVADLHDANLFLVPLENSRYVESLPRYMVGSFLYQGRTVQLMTSPARNVGELLNEFDWNVSRFAYDPRERNFYDNPDAIGKILRKGELSLIPTCSLRSPLSTLRRGFRFSERYDMQINANDLARVVAVVHEKFLAADLDSSRGRVLEY